MVVSSHYLTKIVCDLQKKFLYTLARVSPVLCIHVSVLLGRITILRM